MTSLQDLVRDRDQLAALGLDLAANLVLALLIFFAGRWLAGALVNVLRRAMRRWRVDETLTDFLCNVLLGIALALVVLAALGRLGVDTTSAAALVGGAALAIGLSLQNQLSSFAAGVIIILFRPFSKGDVVEIAGVEGTVEEIKIVSTQLRTADNKTLIVPNASITTQVITNFTERRTRRVEIVVTVDYAADLRRARAALEDVLQAVPGILAEPAPSVTVRNLGASGVELDAWGWAAAPDHGAVRAQLLEAIKLRFDAEQVAFAQPARR